MKNNNKGFTLVEVMVVMGLLGIVLTIIWGVYNYNIKNFTDNSKYYTYKIDGRYAMNKIVNELRKNYGATFAGDGKIKNSGGTVIINSNKNDVDGDIYYYYEPNKYGLGDGYGELRYRNGLDVEPLVQNVKDFKIESSSVVNSGLVKVTIKTGKENSGKIFELVTYVRLY